jgi:hypothetical protein
VRAVGLDGGDNSLTGVRFRLRVEQHCLTALIAFGIVEQLLMWFDFYRYNDEGTVCILFRPVSPYAHARARVCPRTHAPPTHMRARMTA